MSTYSESCETEVEQHYTRACHTDLEKGRIRRGAWLKASALAAILVNPTLLSLWQAAKTAGDVIILPELSGSFDGGSPVYKEGFGDVKENYVGSDFVANIKDPVYKLNHPHYKSLAGKTSWHFVYLTESLLHISGTGTTVAPKNPITESVDDNVIWEAEIKWFEEFTPAPHEVSAELKEFFSTQ